jgi:AcrR family transcriptional regulator
LGEPASPIRRRADALRNEQAILRAGARLLADDPGASMQAIADAAGVSRPTVYRRFPSRDALLAALGQAMADEAQALVEAAADSDAPAAEALAGLIRELGGVAERYPVLFQLLRMRHASDRGGHPKRPVTPGLAKAFDRLVRRGHRDGSIRTDLSPLALRPMVFGSLVASLTASDAPDPRKVANAVAETLLRGVTPRAT